MTQDAASVFTGLKVLDIATFVAAPAAATILSDLGADVVKVEPPVGDPWRGQFTRPGMPRSRDESFDHLWNLAARNKRGIALDLKSAGGQDVLRRLVTQADVLITNFPLAVRERLGLSYESLAELNPRLIYASLTGYGEVGPDKNLPGFDATAWWSRSGLMGLIGPGPDAPPSRSLTGMGDHLTSVALFGAIATGLYRRELTGRGGVVQTSLLASGAWANANLLQAALNGAVFEERTDRHNAPNPLHNHYLCAGGSWISLALNIANASVEWRRLLETLEAADELAHIDIRHFRDLGRHNVEIIRAFDGIFERRSAADWIARLRAARFAVELVPRMEEVASDPQLRATDCVIPTSQPDRMPLTVNSPIRIAGTSRVVPRPAPALGQHSREILSEAGYSADEIENLFGAQAVR